METNDQIHLPLNFAGNASFENFFIEGNEVIVTLLQKSIEESSNKIIYLHGSPGSGKTHLLSASCQKASDLMVAPVYVSLRFDDISFEILSELNPAGLVCVDDIELASGRLDWEKALFNLYESFAASTGRLIFAGRYPPGEIGFDLPDLETRLGSGGVWGLKCLTEDQLPKAVSLQAKKRGLEMPESVIAYLMRRVRRDPVTMFSILNYIDKQSLSHQRRLTVPFVRDLTSHIL